MVPDINALVNKIDYDTKIAEIESKYIINTEFDSKLAQANVIKKRNFDANIIELENNIKILQTFDSRYFRGKSHSEEDGVQNYLVFQPIRNNLKYWLIQNIYHHGNLKDYLTKLLNLMLPLIIVLLH